jgi:hypothetical protein
MADPSGRRKIRLVAAGRQQANGADMLAGRVWPGSS